MVHKPPAVVGDTGSRTGIMARNGVVVAVNAQEALRLARQEEGNENLKEEDLRQMRMSGYLVLFWLWPIKLRLTG
jgi:hypothetical protein